MAVRRSGVKAAIGIRQKNDVPFARFGSWASGLVCNMVHGSGGVTDSPDDRGQPDRRMGRNGSAEIGAIRHSRCKRL